MASACYLEFLLLLRSLKLFKKVVISNRFQTRLLRMLNGDDDLEILKAVKFLQDYSWIYDFKVTNLLSDNIIDRIPEQWVTFLSAIDVNRFNEVFLSAEEPVNEFPVAIAKFISEYRSIGLHIKQSECCNVQSDQLSHADKKGVSIKKMHEISRLAEFIEKRVSKTFTIVDIGSGLGYLGEELTRRGYKVAGVETSEAHIVRAETRRHKTPAHSFQTIQLNITDDAESAERITSLFKGSGEKICLVGLHCCGDLTCSILKLFAKNDIFQR